MLLFLVVVDWLLWVAVGCRLLSVVDGSLLVCCGLLVVVCVVVVSLLRVVF